MMKKRRLLLWVAGLLLAPLLGIHGQDKPPLKLIQKIRLPNVKGRIDHMEVMSGVGVYSSLAWKMAR
jgi:hypothetical protein